MSRGRLSVTALVIGVVVDVGATTVLEIATVSAASVFLGVSTTTEPQMLAHLSASDAFQWAALLMGLLGTFLGGYTAARLAGTRALEHGLLVGITGLIIELYVQSVVGDPGLVVPQWSLILTWFFVAPVGAAGGFAASDSPGAIV